MRISATIHNMDARNESGLPVWNLADRLRKIRRDAHLTQGQIAHELGIKTVTWSAWEAGRNRPDDVIRLATVLEQRYGVPAAWTLGVLPGAHVTVPAQREYGRRATDWLTMGQPA